MGKSNPSARGYATAYNSLISNQFTAGGNKKAGLGAHIGMGPFVYGAIQRGSSGHAAPLYSGRSWDKVAQAKYVTSSGQVQTFLKPAHYPISYVNQIGGVGTPRWGMFNPSADGIHPSNDRMYYNKSLYKFTVVNSY